MTERLAKAIFYLFCFLFFLTPLFWLPVNFELFEFNKMVLVYFLTILIVAFWLMRMIFARKIIFHKTAFFWSLILFLTSQTLATVFSVDRHSSFFGYYSRFHGGLLSTICYVLLFFALVSNGKKDWVKQLINVSLASGFLVACYGIAEHFGIDKNFWVQDVQNRVFSTLGQPNWLAAYLNILIFLLLGKTIVSRRPRVIDFGLLAVLYVCLLFTKSRSGFLGLSAGWLLFWLSIKNKKEVGKPFLFSSLVFFFFSLLLGTPFSPSVKNVLFRQPIKTMEEKGLGNETLEEKDVLITPSSQIRKIVWRGAVALWRQNPILGTGVETFAHTYYWVRPAEHNLTSEWDFLYNKAHNEYLNFAATTGFFGLASYLLIPLFFFKKRPPSAFAAAMTSILVTNFFGFSVVVIGLWFFLLPGLFFLLSLPKEKIWKQKPLAKKQKIALLAVFSVSFWLLWQTVEYWLGDFWFQQGVKLEQKGQFHRSLVFHKKAVAASPNESLYYNKMSLTLADLAWVTYQENQASVSAQLAKVAEQTSNKALAMSPYNLNFYRDRAKMFYILSQVDGNYLKDALETLLRAIRLAPTDAKLYYNVGLMYYSLGENKKGEEYLKKALELKPNYSQAEQILEVQGEK